MITYGVVPLPGTGRRPPPVPPCPGRRRDGVIVGDGSETHAAVDAVVRIESARLIAALARYTGDVGLAEELAQDAVVAALEQWPGSGVPATRVPG